MALRRISNFMQPHACRGISSLSGTASQSCNEILHPIAYYRKFPMFRDGRNDMMETFPAHKNPLLPTDTGIISSRSFPKLVAGFHARGVCLGKALTLDNVGVSTKNHAFMLMNLDEKSLPALTEEGRVKDLNRTGSILDFSVKKSLRDVQTSPRVYCDLLDKLKSENPPYKLILYHPWFFSRYAALWFRIMVDLRLRKEAGHHQGSDIVGKLMVILAEMPHFDGKSVENLISVLKRERVINVWLKKQKLTPEQQADSSFAPNWSREDNGRLLVCVNRDGLAHIFETECSGFQYLKKRMTIEKAIDMLRLEFPDFEYKTVDLFEREKLYPLLGIPELFGENGGTWEIVFHLDEIYRVSILEEDGDVNKDDEEDDEEDDNQDDKD